MKRRVLTIPVTETPSRGTSKDDNKNLDQALKKKDAEIATLQASLKDMDEKVIYFRVLLG